MTIPIVIREMRAEDAEEVAALITQLGYVTNESETQRRFDLLKDRPDARLFVAEAPDRPIVGWIHVQAIYSLETDPRADLWGLVVADHARGAGVGRALVEAAEQWAVRLGFDVMGVRSNQVRVQAKGFYEHLGYRIIKTQNAFRKALSQKETKHT